MWGGMWDKLVGLRIEGCCEILDIRVKSARVEMCLLCSSEVSCNKDIKVDIYRFGSCRGEEWSSGNFIEGGV